MNPTFNKHSGDLITKDYCRSRRLLIQMMYFGVIFVLGVRIGKRLESTCVEFNDGNGRHSNVLGYNSTAVSRCQVLGFKDEDGPLMEIATRSFPKALRN